MNEAELRIAAKRIRDLVTPWEVAPWFGLDWAGDRSLRRECPVCKDSSKSRKTVQLSGEGHDARWWCHHCKGGGDVVDLFAAALGVRKGRAISELAGRLGVSPDPEDVIRYLRAEVLRRSTESKVSEDLKRELQEAVDQLGRRWAKSGSKAGQFSYWLMAWTELDHRAQEGDTTVIRAAEELRSADLPPDPISDPGARGLGELAKVYTNNLRGSPAEAYLTSRGLGSCFMNAMGVSWREWGFGWCPGNNVGRSLLNKWDFGDAAGAGAFNGAGEDVMAGRLTMVIRGPGGEIIGMAGRALDSEAPAKYINTRETKIFRKREVLFGLQHALESIRSSGYAVLVEGYFDTWALHRCGVRQAMAVMGTAPTPRHAELLVRAGAKGVILMFDDDDGGRSATERALCVLERPDLLVKVALTGGGKDPSQTLADYGPSVIHAALRCQDEGHDLEEQSLISRLQGRPKIK